MNRIRYPISDPDPPYHAASSRCDTYFGRTRYSHSSERLNYPCTRHSFGQKVSTGREAGRYPTKSCPFKRRSNRVVTSFATSVLPLFGTTASRQSVIMGTEELASRLLLVIAVIACHLMETARPFGEALERVIILGDSRERSDEVMPIQKAIQSSGDILCEVDHSKVWNTRFSSGGDHGDSPNPPSLKGEALERVNILGDSRERSEEVMHIQKALQSSGVIVCGVDDSMVWNTRFSSGGDHGY
ncbi:uncharacterized protein G2W53_027092 [Senna tora]|uniref:Uncharacterized protein n=1 Tax=Senna tora TaxID=362788 RepID=A0A834TGB4_9FABA|nr:uncharacterized protein G2W53_027092 [Senna tora]